jgi:adenine phosphoribosyltransferase
MKGTSVRRYEGEESYRVNIGGVRREFPVVRVSSDLWIASNAEFILGDVPLVAKAAELLSKKIRRKRVEAVMTAEAKSIALAYEISRRLGHERFIVARKSLKAYMGEHISQKLRSVTTNADQELVLSQDETAYIRGKRVCLLDDVVSTGGTLAALGKLAQRAEAVIVCKAAIWKEGPWYAEKDLTFLDLLPVFVGPKSHLLKHQE